MTMPIPADSPMKAEILKYDDEDNFDDYYYDDDFDDDFDYHDGDRGPHFLF